MALNLKSNKVFSDEQAKIDCSNIRLGQWCLYITPEESTGIEKINKLPGSSSCWAEVTSDSGSAAVSADDTRPGLGGGG